MPKSHVTPVIRRLQAVNNWAGGAMFIFMITIKPKEVMARPGMMTGQDAAAGPMADSRREGG
jgi:hypothetical protein